MAERKKGLSFRIKLDLAFLLLSVALLGGAVVAAQTSAESAARKKIVDDFARTAEQLQDSINSRLQDFNVIASVALTDQVFRSQIGATNDNDKDLGLDEPESDNGLD